MKFNGPVFPSWRGTGGDQSGTRMQWKAHCGKSAQLRNLRQACAKVLKSKDPEVQRQVARVVEAVKHEPLPEFGKLHLVFAAIKACEDTGEKVETCMKYFMDKYDDIQADAAEAANAGQQTAA